ncbi:RNA polymerase sigma-70 factor, ECF subfamily [Clostridium amylolyticum]|uniref:RNA polymerase sigma-70 factor, ECF subfamily n=1 Tax=Clostridium amylolyticum TaxID=1121298 RepID=A0A1M6C531_9CLOT|nr:sigma-70 family RNA polymerase sigma factor [Clostridium amylolyticum]SHI56129.1 RNA polymerase sigma-70 factor, ECF subfamily [Clostridium amylolyticum]
MSIFMGKRKEEFTKLLNPILNKLYRIAYSFLKDKDKASDALQDSTLSAFKNFHALKDVQSFESWITSILVNRCREILRREKKIIFTEYSEGLDKAFPVDEYEVLESNMFIITLLDTLSDKYKEVIKLKYFGDLSIKEISIILNIPEGTVKSRLNYGLNSLRKIVNQEEVEQ